MPIKKYNEFLINERYSMPEAVNDLSLEIMEILWEKMFMWINRKSLANYSELIKFKPKSKSKDFPVNKINIKLNFVLSDKFGFNRSGFSYTFGSKKKGLGTKILKRGDINLGVAFKFYIPKDKQSFNKEEFYKLSDNLIKHELLHSYQSYKVKLKGINRQSTHLTHAMLDFIKRIFDCSFGKSMKKMDLMGLAQLAYISLSPQETSATLAEVWSIDSNDLTLNDIKYIRNNSYETVLKNCVDSIKKDVDVVGSFIDAMASHGIDVDDDVTIDNIIQFLYGVVIKKNEYLYRKYMKILHAKH